MEEWDFAIPEIDGCAATYLVKVCALIYLHHSPQTRRISKYLKGLNKSLRAVVLLLHEIGCRNTSWYQLYETGRYLFDSCDVDVCFMDVHQFRTKPSSWSSLFPRLVTELMHELNALRLSVVGYGAGGGVLLENLGDCGNLSSFPHVLVDPVIPRGDVQSFYPELCHMKVQNRAKHPNLFIFSTKSPPTFPESIMNSPQVKFIRIDESEVEVKKIANSNQNRIKLSASLNNQIIDIIMSD